MMERIILFDIDGTIFNRKKYLNEFYELLDSEFKLSESEVGTIKIFYEAVKLEFGFFEFQAFLERIYINFPKLKDKLDYYFSTDNLDKYIFDDAKAILELKETRIGIFSKGDLDFQRKKINKFEEVIEEDLIFIFHDKIKKLPEIIESNKDSEIFIIDDSLKVLLAVKDVRMSVKTVLMDRENKFEKVNGVDFKLRNLSDIISILK